VFEKLEEIEGLASADFAKDDPIGPVTKRSLEEIPDGDGGSPFCGCRASNGPGCPGPCEFRKCPR